jgi:hypothetical protein
MNPITVTHVVAYCLSVGLFATVIHNLDKTAKIKREIKDLVEEKRTAAA